MNKFLLLFLLIPLISFGQTKDVRKAISGNAISEDLNISTGRTLTFDSGGAMSWTSGATFGGSASAFRTAIGAGTGAGTIGGTLGAVDNSLLRSDGVGGVTAQGTGAFATLSDAGALVLAAYAEAPAIRAGGDDSGPGTLYVRSAVGLGFDHAITSVASAARTIIEPNNSGYHPIVASVTGAVNVSGSEITGTLALGNGGLGITSGTSGGIPYFSAANTIASSAALTANAIVIGGGAGVAPSTTPAGVGVLTALGSDIGAAQSFVQLDGVYGTPSSITLTNANGTAASLTAGTAATATTATNLAGGLGGQIPYQSAAGTTAMLANGTAGKYLMSNGTTLAPSWETVATGLTVGTTTITSGTDSRVLFQAGGVVSQDADFTFVTDTLTATKLATTNLAVTGGTVTVSTPPIAVTQTWNDGAVTFAGEKITITDTASAAASLPWQILGGAAGTTNLAKVSKAGLLTLGDGVVIAGGARFAPSDNTSGGILFSGGNGYCYGQSASSVWAWHGVYGMFCSGSLQIGFSPAGADAGAPDSGFARVAAGSLRATDGGAGDGSLKVATLTSTLGRIKHNKIVTATYTLDTTTVDEVVIGNHATVAFTITLIDATAGATLGRHIVIKNKGAASVTVASSTGSQIFTTSAVASVVLATGDSITLDCDGVVWNVN